MQSIVLSPSAYYPAVGGVEELSRKLARTFHRQGKQVVVLTSRPRDARFFEYVDGVPVFRFRFYTPARRVWHMLRFFVWFPLELACMAAIARYYRVQVLHIQCNGSNTYYLYALARLLRLPLIDTFQGETLADDYQIYQRSAFFPWALRRAVHQATFVTGCSQAILRDAKRYGVPPAKQRVVFNGIDWQEFSGAAKAHKQKYIFALGRLSPVKGFDLLITAFACIAKKHPDLSLHVGGTGTEQPALLLLVKKLRIEKQVVFLGSLDRRQTVSAMRGSLFVVVPSRYDAFGIVAAEALAAGKAVVATTHGGPPEFVPHGVHGLHTDPLRSGPFAATLEKMLRAYPQLQKGAREYARRFDWSAIAARYEELYGQAVR